MRKTMGLAAALAAAAMVVGCSTQPPAGEPAHTGQSTVPVQGQPEPDAPPAPSFQQPYQFGTPQG